MMLAYHKREGFDVKEDIKTFIERKSIMPKTQLEIRILFLK